MLFLEWLKEVRKEVRALLSGSLLIISLGIYQGISGAKVPWWLYAAIICCFLVWACYGTWVREHRAKEALVNPKFDLVVTGLGTTQRDSLVGGYDAVYWRILIENKSDQLLKKCRVVLESFTFTSVGLNVDTALELKDEMPKATAADIPGRDRKQFNFYYNALKTGTDDLDHIRSYAPNRPSIANREGPHSAVLRVNGENLDTRKYKVFFIIDHRGMRITTVKEEI
jgi:hypothetical protein